MQAAYPDNDFGAFDPRDTTKQLIADLANLPTNSLQVFKPPAAAVGIVIPTYSNIANTFSNTNTFQQQQNFDSIGAVLRFEGASSHYIYLNVGGVDGYPTATRNQYLGDASGVLAVISVGGDTGAMPTAGALLYGAGASTAITTLAVGTSGKLLKSDGSVPTWSNTFTTQMTYDLNSAGGLLFSITDVSTAPFISLVQGAYQYDLTFTTALTASAVLTFPIQGGVVATSPAGLVSGRVAITTTGGLLATDSDMTFATDTLTVTKIAATTFTGNITLSTKNIVTDTSTGTKIGTAGGSAGQKLGFFNATPIVQPLLATGAGRTVDDVITALQNLGLVRQS